MQELEREGAKPDGYLINLMTDKQTYKQTNGLTELFLKSLVKYTLLGQALVWVKKVNRIVKLGFKNSTGSSNIGKSNKVGVKLTKAMKSYEVGAESWQEL